jgi:hypothetical protein
MSIWLGSPGSRMARGWPHVMSIWHGSQWSGIAEGDLMSIWIGYSVNTGSMAGLLRGKYPAGG